MDRKVKITAVLLFLLFIITGCNITSTASTSQSVAETATTIAQTTTEEQTVPVTAEETTTTPEETTVTEVETVPETSVTTVNTTQVTTAVMTTVKPVQTTTAAPVVTTTAPVTTAATTVATTTPAPVKADTKQYADVCDNYVYRNLSGNVKLVYDRLVSAIMQCNSFVDLYDVSVTRDEIKSAFCYVIYNEPLCQHVSGRYKYMMDSSGSRVKYIDLSYTEYNQAVLNKRDLLEAKANEILSGITPDMTEYDKALYIHDAIIKGCTYDASAPSANTAYACLVLGRAHCQGYSFAYSYLCRKAGIDCVNVIGYANEDHMWNMVNLGGQWYYTDVTWDDQDSFSEFSNPVHNYFNAISSEIEATRKIYKSNPVPVATTNTDMNYFVKTGSYVTDIAQMQTVVYNQIKSMKQNNENTISLKFKDNSLYQEAKNELFNNQQVFIIYDTVCNDLGISGGAVNLSYLYDDDMNYMTFCFKNSSN